MRTSLPPDEIRQGRRRRPDNGERGAEMTQPQPQTQQQQQQSEEEEDEERMCTHTL